MRVEVLFEAERGGVSGRFATVAGRDGRAGFAGVPANILVQHRVAEGR